MKKWLFAIGLNLSIIVYAQAEDIKLAIINMDILFQEIAQKTGIFDRLEKEFQTSAIELQRIESDLQNKIQHLQRDSSIMKARERIQLEKDVIAQRRAFSQKAQHFEQEHQRRSSEERSKILSKIQKVVKEIAINKDINLVIDSNAIAFNNKNIADITNDTLNRLNK